MKSFSFYLTIFAVFFSFAAHAEPLPRPDHVVVVIEENHGYSQILNMAHVDSTIAALARRGMVFTQSYGVTHPSQPNYLALFSGDTQGVVNDGCPHSFDNDNLATALRDKGLSFAIFSENLPTAGDLSCASGAYQRKHNPLSNWQDTRQLAAMNLPFADFPQDFSKLPTVAFVVPDQNNDMHDGSFEAADEWLHRNILHYAEWAERHNSLLILTFDEDNRQEGNRIVTLFVGAHVKQGANAQTINHYNVLRTLLDFYKLPALGAARDAQTITGVWKKH